MSDYSWPENEFSLFQKLAKDKLGITLTDQKKALVANRLGKRLRALNMESFSEYYLFLKKPHNHQELQVALEAITTNETFFFREMKHFDYLAEEILPKHRGYAEFRVWSAASSIGQEAYSTAMVLDDLCDTPWSILATDVNQQVVEQGRKGIYLDQRTEHIPPDYLRRYCRKGTGPFNGQLRVVASLRAQVEFRPWNLMHSFEELGLFDLVFLRNVMIYFNDETKRDLVKRIIQCIKPGGHLFVGHSEALHGLYNDLERIAPAIYRRRLNE